MRTNESVEQEADRQIVTTRRIHGPRPIVFRAWTEARHLARWFGPRGFATTTHAFEFQEGGVWTFDMHGPDGTARPNCIVWREIVPPQRIAYRQSAYENDPEAFETTVTFTEDGDATEITLRTVFHSRAQRDQVEQRSHAVQGAVQTLDRLDRYIGELQATET